MMPPEREDLQRRREAFQQFLAKLSAEQEEASADTPPGEPQRAHGEGLPPQPPQHQADQQQRQLEAIQRYMSDQDAQRDATDAKRGESPATNHPPSHPRRMSWGRVLLALAAGTAILLPGILIARALRSNTPTCPTSTTSADGTGGSGGATPTAVVVGDSMSTMTAPAGPQIAFPLVTARLLGWHVTVDAHPDTGFATPDGHDPQHPNFAATVGCVAAAHPQIIVVALGSDDAAAGSPAQVIQSKATTGLVALHRRLPRAQLVVVGPLPSGGTPPPGSQAARDAIRAAAQAAHATFIDPIAEGWITGERTDPASGNANRTISPDGRHLTPAGHADVGLRLATDLSQLGLASR